ncbi:MAG: MarC family NAAT transporter [Pseudomonadota bacterium]|nr:MarC family NAAT transporter [Pseudomonadota bacterium]
MATFLLAFGALISIVNPLSGAFIFFGATRELDVKTRSQVARWVAIYAFCIVTASLYVGAYVLHFFGISIPVLRVAGGIIVAMSGWRMLTEPDATGQRRSETPDPRSIDVSPSKLAFYPLTMPLTTGPGTISVAISIGAGRPSGFRPSLSLLEFFVETLAAVALLALLVYVSYRHSARLAEFIGSTGTTIVVRLSAFLLFCIGIQILWNGAAELLGTLPLGSAGAS